MQAPLAIVDVETTGSDPSADRVTEIAVLLAEGGALTSRWTTLVNPATPIPGAIQALTGISQDMVNRAPRFAEIAEELAERLAGRVFVAHNARFDYGFLRREFERAGVKYTARTLCTVRLSRRLYAGHASHNLDNLIARHGIDTCVAAGVPWPSGVPGAGEAPGLMLGCAGTGYFYLRLADPVAVPSALLIR